MCKIQCKDPFEGAATFTVAKYSDTVTDRQASVITGRTTASQPTSDHSLYPAILHGTYDLFPAVTCLANLQQFQKKYHFPPTPRVIIIPDPPLYLKHEQGGSSNKELTFNLTIEFSGG
jgi:hypothetical protein